MITTFKSNQGAITVFFCIIVVVLIGFMSYSFYVGQMVEKRIHLQNTADASIYSLATHASQGLNMISSNNLAIGASLHISGSFVILSYYLSIFKALTNDIPDMVENIFIDTYQRDIWNNIATFPSLFMKSAAGITAMNNFLKNYWIMAAPLVAMEQAKLNIPGSIVIPLQNSNASTPKIIFAYQGLKQVSPQNSLAYASLSAKNIEHKDNIFGWIRGIADSLNISNKTTKLLNAIENVTNEALKFFPINIGFVEAGIGFKYPLLATIYKAIEKIISKGLLIDNFLASYYINNEINKKLDKLMSKCYAKKKIRNLLKSYERYVCKLG